MRTVSKKEKKKLDGLRVSLEYEMRCEARLRVYRENRFFDNLETSFLRTVPKHSEKDMIALDA